MTYKPVGIDENSKFPPRVEARLSEDFAPKSGMDKTYVALDNVDNTSDENKPISGPTKASLDTKAPLESPAFTGTPTGITPQHLGLGNVNNTTDLNKPISTLTKTALDTKAPLDSPVFSGIVKSLKSFEVTDSIEGYILKAPNGTRYRIVVSNTGALSTVVAAT